MTYSTKHQYLLLALGWVLLFTAWWVPYLSLLSLFALVPTMLVVGNQAMAKNANRWLWLVMYLFFFLLSSVALYWLYQAYSPWKAILTCLLFGGILTLFYRLSALVFRWSSLAGLAAIVFGILSHDLLHLKVDFGFPVFSFGHFFRHSPELVQWYTITGALGGSLWVASSNAVLAFAILRKSKSAFLSFLLLAFVPVALSLGPMRSDSFATGTLGIAAVHTNYDPYTRSETMEGHQVAEEVFACYPSEDGPLPKLIVLPEGSIKDRGWLANLDTWNSSRIINKWISDQSTAVDVLATAISYQEYRKRRTKKTLPIGVTSYENSNAAYFKHNTAIFFDGTQHISYRIKQHLVPVEEYLPLANLLGARPILGELADNFTHPGTGVTKVFNTKTAGLTVGSLICYEAAFSSKAAELARLGATVLTVQSEEGWFHHPTVAREFGAMCSLRALETGRYLIKASNRGLSAVYDPAGKVILEKIGHQSEILDARINPISEPTFYTQYGDYLGWLGVFAWLILLPFSLLKRSTKNI